MKLNYTFKHLDHSEALRDYTQSQIEEISRFLLKDGLGNVYYSKHNHEFCVEVSINTHERYFKATAHAFDAYEAVNQVVLKLEKQFLKTRKQYQNHKKPELSRRGKLSSLNSQLEYQFRYKKAA